MSEVTLIHKSDILFNVLRPNTYQGTLTSTYNALDKMHRGEMYIYQNKIYLFNGRNWYKARIDDITEIKSISNQKQILIHFLNYDLMIYSNDYSHLLALRDFLTLFKKREAFDDDPLMDQSDARGGYR